jgi:hypothetical protein
MLWVYHPVKFSRQQRNIYPKKSHEQQQASKEKYPAEKYLNKSHILPLVSKLLFSVLSFKVDNMDKFQTHNQTKYRA